MVSILPRNATPIEVALEDATNAIRRIGGGAAPMIGRKYTAPYDAKLIPFLIAEYGLGEISSYVPNVTQLIDEGISWQRIRGTPAAVSLALSWLTYTSAIEEAPVRRRNWNKFQLALGQVRVNEIPDLGRIDGLATLSVPLRSKFYRGFHGYDVRAAEFSYSKPSMSMYSADSGARITDDGAVWSFGRTYDLDHAPTEAELTSLGAWIAPSTDGVTWAMLDFPWADIDVTWGATVNDVRRRLMATDLKRRSCWVEFKNSSGAAIGYRRARAIHKVAANVNGFYTVGASNFGLGTSASEIVYVEAMTDFGDGDGNTATTAALRFDASPTDLTRPGALWLAPNEITLPSPAIAARAVNIPFGKTVRERVRTLLRITA